MFDYVKIHKIMRNFQMDENKLKCTEISFELLVIFLTFVYVSVFFPLQESTLEIRNNSQKGLNVPNANLVPVTSTSDVIELMNIGQRNRVVGATALNDRSSRSHRYNIKISLDSLF